MSFQITEYLLWKTVKGKENNLKEISKNEETALPGQMVCRVCTNPADIPLTQKVDDFNIMSAMSNIANIMITNKDCYPKYICRSCLDELKIALEFKRKCQAADLYFRKAIGSEKIEENTFPPMVYHDFALIIQQMKERRLSQSKASKRENKLNTAQTCEKKKIEKNKPHVSREYKCKRCDMTFIDKESLMQHRLEHNSVCPPCPECGKIVLNLARHKQIVHLRAEKYTCHICGKISYSAGGLRNHLLVHSDKFEYPCPHCPYKGKQQAYLTLHMRVHTGERPYLCSQCPAKFVNPSNLRKHSLVHSNKKFECAECKKQFRMQKSLQEHYDAAHLNVRYRCTICGRDLWTRRKLLSHELRVHGREKRKLYDDLYKVVVNDDND